RSRFGSNSRQSHRISLALELVHYDVSVLDSVVIHELCHHFHFDHGEGFHSLCLRFCPNYPRLRKALLEKDYGYHPDLEEK
ncbi:MAG: M48 family metallopeptidase, partial [Bacilli bacterium]|nr:M48 family metallopeptidase [Bacilli bacterium]